MGEVPKGAIILATSTWNCNLDRSEHHCNPEWNFKRIDGQDESMSSGFNYRTVTYDTTENSRSLAKLYGIRFVFVTEGTAGRFSVAAMTVTFGAGLAYMSVAAIIADFIMLKFLGKTSEDINKAKNEEIKDENGLVLSNISETLNKENVEIVNNSGPKGMLCCRRANNVQESMSQIVDHKAASTESVVDLEAKTTGTTAADGIMSQRE